jgi:hypothetical protein
MQKIGLIRFVYFADFDLDSSSANAATFKCVSKPGGTAIPIDSARGMEGASLGTECF